MKSIRIKWKIYLFLLGFCGVLLLILWLAQVVFLDQFYRYVKIREIRHSAAQIEKNINRETLGELIEQIATDKDMVVQILFADGKTLHSTGMMRDGILSGMVAFEKARILASAQERGGELILYYNRGNLRESRLFGHESLGRISAALIRQQQTIIYVRIMSQEGGEMMAILMNSAIAPVDATINTLRIQLYSITAFMLVFSVILAFVIAKRVSQPIEKINENAKRLGKGNEEVFFSEGGYKEIDELADTLNYTAKELLKAERLRKELIANISHDLRTPLTLISGYAEAMCDLPGEMSEENARVIVQEANRLTALVNDVLNISKLQSGTQQMNLISYPITKSICEAVDRMSVLLKKDGYKIRFLQDQEVVVIADEAKISQAFYNLLINGVNYTGEDKTILVKQTVEKEWIKIAVSDTGQGIEEEELPYIWERYYKGNKSHGRSVMGNGLGLSIVKAIMELHGGEYGVSSKYGEGSVFWFALPLIEENLVDKL